jgi:Rel homology dimerisation domain/Rel homology DNA-binding domain
VSPHIFYQACKVSGKNSTPCYETKTEGTMVIEIELKPENDMTVICDCVGILKERNVDVEHRLGRNHSLAASVTRNKKKSTKCRMIFRTKVNDDTDFPEILQICSNTITCTQPPGVPEICKKSLETCSVIGGQELFIIGKNFLKDTKVTFVRFDESRQPKKMWEETVQPDKEYLQQTHLICVVPSYPNGDSVNEPVHVQIYVTSSNKKSEAHNFCYLPLKKSRSIPQSPVSCDSGGLLFSSPTDTNSSAQQMQNVLSIGWNESPVTSADNMMPPPLVMPRKASFSKNLPDTSPTEAPITLKTEFIDQTVINDVSQQQDVTTSSIAGLQPVFHENGMIDVTGMQNPFVASSQVQNILDGFKMQSNDGNIDLQRIKNEQSPDQVSSSPTSMLPPPPPTQELNSVQQQQVVENFLNLIVQSSVMSEPNLVENHHHLSQNIILNSPSAVLSSNVAIQPEQLVNSAPNINILNSAISPSMMCEPNMMGAVQIEMNSTGSPNVIVSNAVSDATAETQAVVKQMIAQAAAEMLSESENAAETQSTISTFISNILPAPEQQQIPSSQQLQEMLNAATSSLMQEVKKEETIV